MTIDELVANPGKAELLTAQEITHIILQLTSVAANLSARLASYEAPPPTKLLTIKEAAPRLGMSPSTLYKRAQQEPYRSLRVFTGNDRVIFSPEKIAAFVANGGAHG